MVASRLFALNTAPTQCLLIASSFWRLLRLPLVLQYRRSVLLSCSVWGNPCCQLWPQGWCGREEGLTRYKSRNLPSWPQIRVLRISLPSSRTVILAAAVGMLPPFFERWSRYGSWWSWRIFWMETKRKESESSSQNKKKIFHVETLNWWHWICNTKLFCYRRLSNKAKSTFLDLRPWVFWWNVYYAVGGTIEVTNWVHIGKALLCFLSGNLYRSQKTVLTGERSLVSCVRCGLRSEEEIDAKTQWLLIKVGIATGQQFCNSEQHAGNGGQNILVTNDNILTQMSMVVGDSGQYLYIFVTFCFPVFLS